MSNLEGLEAEIQQLEAEANEYRRNGNEAEYILKMREANAKRSESELQVIAFETKAAIIAEANNPESSFTLTVDGYEVDFRTESASEESYQALRIVTQLKLQELEQQNQAEIKALKSSYEIERQQFELQIDNLESIKNRLNDANLQNADLERKRAIAASEVESLKAQVEELRAQVSKPNVPTNLDNGALVEAMQKLKASKPAIYNVVEINGTKSTAINVETNETIEFHPNYIGKYRVISDEEAHRFQQELQTAKEAAEADMESIPQNVEPVEVEEFREPIPAPEIATVQEHTVHGEVDAEGVKDDSDGESFEQAVERRLRTLELTVYQNFTPVIVEAA